MRSYSIRVTAPNLIEQYGIQAKALAIALKIHPSTLAFVDWDFDSEAA